MDITPATPPGKKARAKSPAAAPIAAPVAAKPSRKKASSTSTATERSRKKATSEIEVLAVPARVAVSSDQLTAMISTAAYYRAADRGFAPGHDLEDWLQAEREVMNSIG
jgi:hypothetical protein